MAEPHLFGIATTASMALRRSVYKTRHTGFLDSQTEYSG